MDSQTKVFDPRYAQIAILLVLLTIAFNAGFIPTPFWLVAIVIALALCLQALANFVIRQTVLRENWQSALISALSLILLFRSNSTIIWLGAVMLTILPKFLLRIGDKHCFNPTNFAIVTLVFFNQGWISHGRWGHWLWGMAFLMLGGLFVLAKVRSYQVTAGFFLTYAGGILVRGLYLNDPFPLILHQFSHISLIIFAFFMISDPRTVPNEAKSRWAFGMVVGLLSVYWQYWQFEPNAIFYSLFVCYPLVWMLDAWQKAPSYQWHDPLVYPSNVKPVGSSVSQKIKSSAKQRKIPFITTSTTTNLERVYEKS